MKLRTVKLTPPQLIQMLQGKATSKVSNLPTDAELLDVKMDLLTRQIFLVVRSDSFEDVADAVPIPEFNVAAATEPKPVAASVSAVLKIEPKPVISKPTQPPASRYAAKMENEFSPDQRKLLSFNVKGDCVVVKPVTFLKTEWDDINEVVRSLGGKWVKGDIISYWEIPLQ